MNNLICPVCKNELLKQDAAFRCANGHSFDIASQGYVNLIPAGKARAGDSREMVAARFAFLEKGYYHFLRKTLCTLALQNLPENSERALVDAGCGEGYYTTGLAEMLAEQGRPVSTLGLDISKSAVRLAAKRGSDVQYVVASLFDMPVRSDSADMVVNIFAPVCGSEFRRVLHSGGILVIVGPGPRHLFGLKEILYEHPYENKENRFDLGGFVQEDVFTTGEDIRIPSRADIENLFKMTPYYWKTGSEDASRLETMDSLDTWVEFEIRVYRKL